MRELERAQKSRATRTQRDALDRALVDLAAFYRDVLLVQAGSPVAPPTRMLPRTCAPSPRGRTAPGRCGGSTRCLPAARRWS